jgi:hypothetical protein
MESAFSAIFCDPLTFTCHKPEAALSLTRNGVSIFPFVAYDKYKPAKW